ncbi:MAG: hypothetical protein ACRD22_20575 [Terriglobia bacterium]
MKQLRGYGVYCLQGSGRLASAALLSESYHKMRGGFAFLCAALLLCVLVCISGTNLQAGAVVHPQHTADSQFNSSIWLLLGIGLAAWLGIWRLAVKTREPEHVAADSRIAETMLAPSILLRSAGPRTSRVRLDDLAASEQQQAMTITISVSEQLRDRAAAHGLPVEAYVGQIFGAAAQNPALCQGGNELPLKPLPISATCAGASHWAV